MRKITSTDFLQYYSEIVGKGNKVVFKLARAILDLCVTETWYGRVQPSHLASTALLAPSYLFGKGWPELLATTTGHCPTQLLDKLVTILNMVDASNCVKMSSIDCTTSLTCRSWTGQGLEGEELTRIITLESRKSSTKT